jgi:hypothetical protein
MTTTVKLSDEIVAEARRYSTICHRSISKQIEYWAHIGKIVEENPDLPYNFLKEILLAMEEAKEGELTDYQPGNGN